jgi:CheY-like chemotaxis protein
MEHSPDASRKVILLVDDDNVCRTLTHRLLVELGYRVESAHDAEEAIEMFHEHPPDLVLTDQIMIGMSGTELAHILKDSSPRTLVVLYTSSVPQDTACLDLVLQKPAMSASLGESLARLLREGHSPPKADL